jgi:hypothetical protein
LESRSEVKMSGLGLVYKKSERRVREIKESFMNFLDSNDKRRIKNARRYEDWRMEQEYKEEHRKGYCPTCFCLRMKSGKCPNGCDSTRD